MPDLNHYFKVAFANSGDVAPIPELAQGDGSVSFEQGFGPDYSLDPAGGGDAKRVPRPGSNELYNLMTVALQEYQQFGTPAFITAAQNGGAAYSYAQYARVQYAGVTYTSLKDANTSLPTVAADWRSGANEPFASGFRMGCYNAAAPVGWTQDTTASLNNSSARIVTGAGGGTGGTVNFDAAFASQAVAGSVTVNNHTLTTTEIPAHTHTYVDSNDASTSGSGFSTTSSNNRRALSKATGSAGGGAGHNHGASFNGTAIDLAVKYVDQIIIQKD